MEVSPQTVPPNFKRINNSKLFNQTHERFQVSIYKEKIKFDKIWVYQNGGFLKRDRQISNFLITPARHMKFLGLANIKEK